MVILFWLSLAFLLYTYIGYPVLMAAIGSLRPRKVAHASIFPKISIIIVAHNEERAIGPKLENTLSLDYPQELREIIVVSDGSTDRTMQISLQFEPLGVRCIELRDWLGKSIALNHAMDEAQGEIIVFTDVAAIAERDCLKQLVMGFADQQVGCISAETLVLPQGAGGSESTYVRYLMLLRRLESRVGSCTCVCGPFYAARREACPVFSGPMATDLHSALESVRGGYRTISDPQVQVRLGSVPTQREEFWRKVRTIMIGIACVPVMQSLMNPLRYGWFPLELVSHKLFRWVGGVFMASLLVANVVLANESRIYMSALVIQGIIYTLALVGALSERLATKYAAVRLSFFVVHTHLAGILALWKHARGERAVIWRPTVRQEVRVSVH